MTTITKHVVLLILCFSLAQANAQDSIQKTNNHYKIESLKELKETIQKEEREYLKTEVEAINQRLEKGEITQEKADTLKKEAAKKRALNIENRLAIIDNKIALLQRNDTGYDEKSDNNTFTISIGSNDDADVNIFRISGINKPKKFDRRTTSDLVIAFGLNNAIIDGESFDDTPYEIGGSRFFEIGWAWKTRVFNNSNFLRIKYGFSFQVNGLKPTDNRVFEQNGNITTLEEFEFDLSKSKLKYTNLVFPVHLEFGPSKKIEHDTYFRYSTRKQFKVGVGGYAGFNTDTRQKLKYSANGDRVKEKINRDYNTTDFVYGLSSYIAFGSTALYVKYDLSPIFKDQTVDQNNISLGLRFDMD
jgi:hypothetical protein